MKKRMFSQRLFRVLLVLCLIIGSLLVLYLLGSEKVTAVPDHITLTWAADPETTQTITWRTEINNLAGQVQYVEDTGNKTFLNAKTITAAENSLTTSAESMNIHSVTLTELKPGTRYLYRVGDGSRWSKILSFSTPETSISKFKFLIFGDSQSYKYDVWRATLQQAFFANPDAVFMTNVGDLVDVGLDYSQWNGWFTAGKGVIDTISVMPVVGNHETYTPEQGLSMPVFFTAQFKLPANGPQGLKGQVYSFDYGNVHFTMLDSQEGEEKEFVPTMLEQQKEWLEKDLKETKKQWRIVFIHRPPYHNRSMDGDEHLRAAFVPIFDKYHVDAVFAGHDHVYARSYPLQGGIRVDSFNKGTIYITTGRSGTKTYPKALAKQWNEFFYNPQDEPNYLTVEVEGANLNVKAFKQSGILIDSWVINK